MRKKAQKYNKILLFSLLIIILFAGIRSLYAQDDETITLYSENQSLKSVLLYIANKANINFVFKDQLIKGKKITCAFNCVSIEYVLNQILSPLHISHKWTSNNVIVLFEEEIVLPFLEGVVLDAESKTPLPYANILLKGSEKGGTSDSAGYFKFKNIVEF